MADENTAVDSELEEATDDAEGKAALETSEESSTSEDEAELLEDETLESEQSNTQKTAEGQIRKAKELIADGKELPDSLKWVKEKGFLSDESSKKQETDPNHKPLTRDDLLFDSLAKEWKDLPKNERKKVKEKLGFYKSKNFSRGEALQEAMGFVVAQKSAEKAKRDALAGNAELGQVGDSAQKDDFDPLQASDDEIVANMVKRGIIKTK